MFHSEKLMKHKDIKNVWQTVYNLNNELPRWTSIPVVCNKIEKLIEFKDENARHRLSLRFAALLNHGTAKLYKMEIDKLLKDVSKLDKKMWFRKRSSDEMTETGHVSEAKPHETSPIISYAPKRRKLTIPKFTEAPISDYTEKNLSPIETSLEALAHVSDVQESLPSTEGQRSTHSEIAQKRARHSKYLPITDESRTKINDTKRICTKYCAEEITSQKQKLSEESDKDSTSKREKDSKQNPKRSITREKHSFKSKLLSIPKSTHHEELSHGLDEISVLSSQETKRKSVRNVSVLKSLKEESKRNSEYVSKRRMKKNDSKITSKNDSTHRTEKDSGENNGNNSKRRSKGKRVHTMKSRRENNSTHGDDTVPSSDAEIALPDISHTLSTKTGMSQRKSGRNVKDTRTKLKTSQQPLDEALPFAFIMLHDSGSRMPKKVILTSITESILKKKR